MRPENSIPWFRSIRFKLVAVALLVEAIILALLVANTYRLINDSFESQTRVRLEAIAPLLDTALASRVFQRDHSEIRAFIEELTSSKHAGIRYIVVMDAGDEVLARGGALPANMQPPSLPRDQTVLGALIDNTYDTSTPLTIFGTRVGTVRFGLSLDSLVTLRDALTQQNLAIAFIAILLSLLLLVAGGYFITQNLISLTAATRRIASADYSAPIEVVSRDEIGLLADSFNRMTATIQSRIEELATSEARFRTIFDAAGDAFFILAIDSGRIVDVNRRMCEMFGCTRSQALEAAGSDFTVGVKPYTLEDAQKKLHLVARSGPQTFEWLTRRLDDGHQFWVEINLRRARIGAEDRIIALVRDISERKRYQFDLEFLAHHDALTQLPNRALFTDRLQLAMAQTKRAERLLAIAYLDLDGFKAVNDKLGHAAGDRLLIMVAERLQDATRAGDTVCRLGGDEFSLLLDNLANIDICTQTLQRLLTAIAAPYQIDGQEVRVSGSIGVTLYPFDDADTDTLMRHADQAMYIAKQSGRNRYHLFDAELDRDARARHGALTRLEQALEQDEFVLYYQPRVNMRTGKVLGVEALIRWQHPDDGLLAPASFMPVADDSSLAIPLGEWVIETAVAQLADWRQDGLRLDISVNISPRHLQASDFATQLAAILARYPDVPPRLLELEIVESAALEDMAQVTKVIEACQALGVRFALDDFGTGYSSLSYFKRLKVDVLKIDQSFVRDLLEDAEDYAIVSGVIALTRAFAREVVAEGVETAAIGAALIALDCPLAQGYGIARPMPAADVPAWIASWQPGPWARLPQRPPPFAPLAGGSR